MIRACPACGSAEISLVLPSDRLAGDLERTRTWGHKLTQSEPADVLGCTPCGSLFRVAEPSAAELADRYRDDKYGVEELARLHRVDVATSRRRRSWLRGHGLTPGAQVLEVGSYAGGLLAVADAGGCVAIGVDVGRETSAFSRRLGFDVRTGELDAHHFRRASFDAIFVLNCFEQLPDPVASLAEMRRLLRTGGSLVIRTPDADFVRTAHAPAARAVARRSGVLGMPFARCLSSRALDAMLRAGRFHPVDTRGVGGPWMHVAARAA